MESFENSCSVIQYYKGTENDSINTGVANCSSSLESYESIDNDLKKTLPTSDAGDKISSGYPVKVENNKGETSEENYEDQKKRENNEIKEEPYSVCESESAKIEELSSQENKADSNKVEFDVKTESEDHLPYKKEEFFIDNEKSDIKRIIEGNQNNGPIEGQQVTRGRKRKLSGTTTDIESGAVANTEDVDGNDESLDSDLDGNEEIDKPRRRGRKKGKKSMDVIPSHLSSDMVLGYKMLMKFLETPQFSGFHKPFKRNNEAEEGKITGLNQIKKKFEENSYNMISEFVKDIREMLTNIYESRNSVAIKRALRLEQVLEQRIAQLPNYLRPQCALVLPPEETNNSVNKIRINKGGGFVSLLLEKTEKQRYEKNKEKRKILAEERKQLKEEQDKDVQEWEKNVLLKNHEEDIKSMWELPAIGHFIHLCADILNIGEVAQFEIERMLLMPQCSDTLDLIMTALLTNSLMRAKLDRTPSMPYNIWSPLVRTRVMSWYRTWHKEGRNEQKLFEEIGIEPEFWKILGPDLNPLDYYYFHEITLFQRVWVLKTLCDVDFIRKKTVHDNIRVQPLDELSPIYLGVDRHGNRYIQLKQFCATDIRIYRESSKLIGDITMSEYVEGFEGFEFREGPITVEKVFRDIWELNDKMEVKTRKKKISKAKRQKTWSTKIVPESSEKKNLRKSVRAKQKTYVDWSDSDQSDTDLNTLKKKLTRSYSESLYRPFSNKEFISLSVFRLPRDKVSKPTPKKSGYVKKSEDPARLESALGEKSAKTERDDNKEELKQIGCYDEQSDSLDAKQMQDMQSDFEKTFHGDDINGDEFDLDEKLDKESEDVKFAVKNLEKLKLVLKKGVTSEREAEELETTKERTAADEESKMDEKADPSEKEYDSRYKYNVPEHLKPDSSKFYLVVDSVEGLRQLISKFGSHENDLEIITRSSKTQKKKITPSQSSHRSCEVELIEKLQNLLLELEPWELDFMKSQRSNKEKMYKEYTNFINRSPDFVHPNESYWMKTCEEPVATTTSSTAPAAVTTMTNTSASAGDKSLTKEVAAVPNESLDLNQQDNSLDSLGPRRRTRVTRLQLQPEDNNNDSDEDYDAADDYESNESDDNWVLPTSKKKAKKDTTTKTLRYPRRTGGRKLKSATVEKIDSSTNTGEKSQYSSPEKTKKALFWGPRSSDPSEDLNWEKNRQKILEQHNSPVKKTIYKTGETGNDVLDGAGNVHTSVIATSPKRLPPPIPGNKKPYFSSAQLKAMESQAKQIKLKEAEVYQQKTILVKSPSALVSGTDSEAGNSGASVAQEFLLIDSNTKTSAIKQCLSQASSALLKQSPTIVARLRQPPLKQVTVPVVTKLDASGCGASDSVKFSSQVKGQNPVNPVNNQKTQIIETVRFRAPGSVIQQRGVSHVQQPPGQAIQNKTVASSVANARVQPVQWQSKVIAVQTLNPQGKIVQQQLQTQAQVQVQDQPQVQLQSTPPVQGQQLQQVIQLEPQKWAAIQQPTAVQIPTERPGAVQQMIIAQQDTPTNDGDLYLTDGKTLMKFDDSFLHQYLTKDKVVAVNVNDKSDVKKTLLIVKPKAESNPGSAQVQVQQSTSQTNVVVGNKPVAGSLQQSVASTSLQNIVIPTNYIIKESSNPTQSGQQNVKIVQQAPAYIIQQKAIPGKNPQPQILKIITSQPMSSSQSLILSPAISGGSQVIRPVAQAVDSGDQSKSPTTIRLLRPHVTTSVSQGKLGSVQSPIIVNNIVQLHSQNLETSKTQVVASRILSTGTPTVRMATPVQAQQLVSSANASHGIKLSGQPLKVVMNSSTAQTHVPTSVTLNAQAARPGGNTVRLALGTANQGVLTANHPSLQSGAPTNTVNAVRVVTTAQPHQEQAIIATVSPQAVSSAGDAHTHTLRVVAAGQALQVQSQGVASSPHPNQVKAGSLGGQTVRLATLGQAQTVKLFANSSLGPRIIRQVTPNKVAVIATATHAQVPGSAVASVRPVGVPGQSVRLQAVRAVKESEPTSE